MSYAMKEKISKFIPQLLEALKELNPLRIMIFGSYAKDNVGIDSDLDLLIILDNHNIPATYDEKINMKLNIRRAIRKINQQIPIDIFVYTIPEYEALKKNMTSFFKEINESAKIIYEKAS